jgi:hypothetical protein
MWLSCQYIAKSMINIRIRAIDSHLHGIVESIQFAKRQRVGVGHTMIGQPRAAVGNDRALRQREGARYAADADQ